MMTLNDFIEQNADAFGDVLIFDLRGGVRTRESITKILPFGLYAEAKLIAFLVDGGFVIEKNRSGAEGTFMDPPAVKEENQEPGPWSGKMIQQLQERGIIPKYAHRVIIDIEQDGFVRMHVQMTAEKGDDLIDVLAANLIPATVEEKEQ